jgi:hypothetical protein
MGWKGALRSYNAAVKAAERESIREQRELIKEFEHIRKQNLLRQAQIEVNAYNNLIERLVTMHRDCGQVYEWAVVKELPAPTSPDFCHRGERAAIDRLNDYRPTIFDRIFRLTAEKKKKLNVAVETAKKEDEEKYATALKNYHQDFDEWQEMHDFADAIVQGDSSVYAEVLKELKPFDEIDTLGSKVIIQFKTKDSAEIDFHVNGSHIIPTESKSLLKNGMVSAKKLSLTTYYELYQDYVASSVLRIAREIFAILPLKNILITALADRINSSTGKFELQPLISVLITHDITQNLNFDALDPSDALRNFPHNSNFKKNKGFTSTERLAITWNS